MATIGILLEEKKLHRVTVPLRRGQFHDRKLYALPDCFRWMKGVRGMVTGRIKSASTPYEQMIERFRQWTAGEPMLNGPWFHDMEPCSDNVWEMKTDDLRIFGWMYRPREFIAAVGGYADDYKEPTKTKTYTQAMADVIAARDALPLDEPKYTEGEFDELV
jgi:hypothetical protein